MSTITFESNWDTMPKEHKGKVAHPWLLCDEIIRRAFGGDRGILSPNRRRLP
jgi:hypothetical protein